MIGDGNDRFDAWNAKTKRWITAWSVIGAIGLVMYVLLLLLPPFLYRIRTLACAPAASTLHPSSLRHVLFPVSSSLSLNHHPSLVFPAILAFTHTLTMLHAAWSGITAGLAMFTLKS
jgi:hypothetical protein